MTIEIIKTESLKTFVIEIDGNPLSYATNFHAKGSGKIVSIVGNFDSKAYTVDLDTDTLIIDGEVFTDTALAVEAANVVINFKSGGGSPSTTPDLQAVTDKGSSTTKTIQIPAGVNSADAVNKSQLDGLGNKINEAVEDVTYNGLTAALTISYINGTSSTISLPKENFINDAIYDNLTKVLTLYLVDGATVEVPLSDLVDVYTEGTGIDISDNVISIIGLTVSQADKDSWNAKVNRDYVVDNYLPLTGGTIDGWLTATGNVKADSLIKDGSDNTRVLLGGGLDKPLSEFMLDETVQLSLPAKIGWYRIASSVVFISDFSGQLQIIAEGANTNSITHLTFGCAYGVANGTVLNILGHSTYTDPGISQVRLVYNPSFANNYAYLEVYNPHSVTKTITVTPTGLFSGKLLDEAVFIDNLESGYRADTVNLTRGITANSFVMQGSSDSYVLLGGGTHRNLNDFLFKQSRSFTIAANENTGNFRLAASKVGAKDFSGNLRIQVTSSKEHSSIDVAFSISNGSFNNIALNILNYSSDTVNSNQRVRLAFHASNFTGNKVYLELYTGFVSDVQRTITVTALDSYFEGDIMTSAEKGDPLPTGYTSHNVSLKSGITAVGGFHMWNRTNSEILLADGGFGDVVPVYNGWTPSLEGLTTAGVAVYTTRIGRIVKVGKLINVLMEIKGTFTTAPTGQGVIKGIGTSYKCGTLGAVELIKGNYFSRLVQGELAVGDNEIKLVHMSGGLPSSTVPALFGTHLSNTNFSINFQMQYLIP